MKNMVLTTTVAAWLCVQAVYVQVTENSCRVDGTEEGCAKRVICNFKEEVVKEKREFTISLRKDSGDEMIADCNWVRSGIFDCDPATGYTCDPQLSVFFSVNITKSEICIKSGEFKFEVVHEKPFSCKIAPVQVNSDNASANANPVSLNICGNSTGEKKNGPNRNKRNTNESEDQCQEGASEQETNTGMIIGVVCTCLLAGVGVLLLVVKRNKLVAFIRKRKVHEGACVEAADYNPAVEDFEKRECLIPETVDSTEGDTLKKIIKALKELLEALHLLHDAINTFIKNVNPPEHDAAFDVSSVHCTSSCDGDDNDCGSSSKQT